jgi:hypothetical protein
MSKKKMIDSIFVAHVSVGGVEENKITSKETETIGVKEDFVVDSREIWLGYFSTSNLLPLTSLLSLSLSLSLRIGRGQA